MGKPYMMAQNELLREYALGNFKEMVTRIARDPAMLVWLDNRSNVKNHPNENWSRELLELFTMGEGNYTDQDVMEAARAFTGWGLKRRGAFHFFPGRHDFGAKTFLNRSGAFDGDDIIDIIFEQDATAEFISRKLFAFFVHPDPPEELIAELAKVFRQNDYEIRPLMRAIFEHPEFYSDRAYRSLIKSPADLFVGLFRELGKSDTVFLPRFMASTGQELFAPPDVSGMDQRCRLDQHLDPVGSLQRFQHPDLTSRTWSALLRGMGTNLPTVPFRCGRSSARRHRQGRCLDSYAPCSEAVHDHG